MSREDSFSTTLASLVAYEARQFPTGYKMLLKLVVFRLAINIVDLTSCDAGRLFSRLIQLKSYCRSTIKEERLNGLALMLTHKVTIVSIPAVVCIRSKISSNVMTYFKLRQNSRYCYNSNHFITLIIHQD